MNRAITWLHLSDLHARLRDDWDSRKVTDALVRDLKDLQKGNALRPDLIFFTGDSTFGAAAGERIVDQYQLARSFFDAVRMAFTPEVPLRDLYIVPGNHDVDRGEITEGETDWLRNPDRKLQDILAAMRDNTKQWRAWMERLAPYRNFLTSYGLLHLAPDDPHLIWADAREFHGVRVGITGLNSAWSCANREDKAKLWCGADWQIAQLKQRLGPVMFSFALIHHPGNWFTHREDPVVMRRLRQEFPLVLHGHEHDEWVEIDSDGRVTISAGACYNSSWMANGYSWGQVDLDNCSGDVRLRQWDGTGGGWVPRNIAGKTREGVWPLKNLAWLQPSAPRDATRPVAQSIVPRDTVGHAGERADEHYARRFCQHVVDQNDVLELFGCDIPRELQRHQLSVAYVSLNLSSESDEEGTAKSRKGSSKKVPKKSAIKIVDDEESEEEIEEYGAGIEHVLDDTAEGTGRLMIRGPAGAGKSTLLRWCAIHAGQQVLNGPPILARASRITRDPDALEEWNHFKDANMRSIPHSWRWKIPILIRLRDCPDGKLPAANDLPRFLAKHLPSPPDDWMSGVLDAGRALILLDGVDEIHRDQRPQLAEEISELIQTYPDCNYVITTRPGAVERGWLERLNFTEARVEPMSRADREEFMEKWYRSAALELKHRPRPGEDLVQTAKRLKAELTDQPELGVLASNPLLCAMICALYRERQERLPETPAELCESLVQMLLHRRERETPGLQSSHFLHSWRDLQYPQKKGLLADLAWHMVSKGDSSIDLETARAIVAHVMGSTPGRSQDEAGEVLQALIERSGLLRLAGDDAVDFLHNTLKEYLAAGKAVEVGNWESLVDHADDPAWQPVILFTLALAAEPFSSGIVRRLLARVPAPSEKYRRKSGSLSKRERVTLAETNAKDFFLVRCRSAAKRLAADLSSSIDSLTHRLFPPIYMQEAEALAQLGPRIMLHGAETLLDSGWWAKQDARTAARCLRLLRLIGGPRAAAGLHAIKKLPSHSSYLTGEWLLASTELAESALPWPFQETVVWANNTRVSDLRPLAALPRLKNLNLRWTQVSDISPLSANTALLNLNLAGTKVSDLEPIACMSSLRILNLVSTRVSNLEPLSRVLSLEMLLLDGTKITEICALAGLASLARLDLDRTAVTDVTPLTSLPSLKTLFIQDTGVTDLDALIGISSLREIYLRGAKVTKEQIAAFQTQRPNVRVSV